MSNVIECVDVWKSYGHRSVGIMELLLGRRKMKFGRYSREWALQSINFNVKRGQSIGVVGHNGTGKSTLLAMLLGTIRPDQGSIKVRGRVASLLDLGAGFHPELSGRENIFLYGAILGMTIRETRMLLDQIVEFSELGPAIDQQLRTYSSGMMARLGFSTIIHAPADLLLIDEVLAVGDTRFKEKCLDRLIRFQKNNGTLVIVSHEMQSLIDMCEVGMCLDMGQMVKQGDMREVVSHYQRLIHEGMSKKTNNDHAAAIGQT